MKTHLITTQFDGAVSRADPREILFSLKDSLELVDYIGRAIRPDKRGAIPADLPSILNRLNLD